MATLPQARIPLGWAIVAGQRTPIEIDIEWMRAFTELLRATGTGSDSSVADLLPLFFATAPTDPLAQEAIRAVDELRNELASARSDVQNLRGDVEALSAQLASPRPDIQLRNRVELIEDRLQ